MQKVIVKGFADWSIRVDSTEETIDLFCQNIIQYSLGNKTSNNSTPFANLKVPLGLSPAEMLKLHHDKTFEPNKEEDILAD